MSRDEISGALEMESTEIPDDENGFEEPNAHDMDEDEALDLDGLAAEGEGDEDHDDEDYDGEVNLNGMGDIGSTA